MSHEVTQWTPNQLRFIEWLAVPSEMREPRFQCDLAKEIGVKRETLSRWKRLPGLTEEASRLARALLKDDLPEIFGALRREARAGSFQHIKLALEVAGEHTDEVNVNVADRRAAIASRLAAIAEEERRPEGNGQGARSFAPNAN